MALQVVGSGLGRTGTKSLQTALTMLGLGPCHHMVEVFAHSREHGPVDRGRGRTAGLGRHLRALPLDGGLSGRRLLARAGRLLSGRQGAAFGARPRPVVRVHPGDDLRPNGGVDQALANPDTPMAAFFKSFSGASTPTFHDRAAMTDYFRRHTEAVKATIAPERLLVYEVGSGWEPLCALLRRPGPRRALSLGEQPRRVSGPGRRHGGPPALNGPIPA